MSFKSVNILNRNNPNKVRNAQIFNMYYEIYKKNSHATQKLSLISIVIVHYKSISSVT